MEAVCIRRRHDGRGCQLASFLADELAQSPRKVKVEPFLFSGNRKTGLSRAIVALIDRGRINEFADDGDNLTRAYLDRLAMCTYEDLPGPDRLLRWSVPTGRRHDDLLISTPLTARLDQIDWRPRIAHGTGSRT